ncbi:MAG: DUF192 domain-containing protein [Anaerolineales bacterium]|nr:DUF192 domain-containing protein [Anaerolineales bacterium]
MPQVSVKNLTKPPTAPLVVNYCDSFLSRLRGLTFRSSLPHQEGILLVQSRDSRIDSAIHMLGVFMDLAVAWIDDTGEVVDVRLARRWRPIYVPQRPARYILEMASSRLKDFRIGDKVEFKQL